MSAVLQHLRVGERWVDVAGWEGCYAVSDLGRVSGVKGILKPQPNPHRGGYVTVLLKAKGRKQSRRYVHRLVAEHFVEGYFDGAEVRHKNRTPTDCSASNLLWGTRQDNANDRTLHGTQVRGSDTVMSKLRDEDVRFIRENRSQYLDRELAERFGVSKAVISDVSVGKTWRHLLREAA